MDLRLWLVSAVESVPHIRCCVKAELVIVTEEGERKFSTSFAPNSIKTVRKKDGEPQAEEPSAAPKPGATRREGEVVESSTEPGGTRRRVRGGKPSRARRSRARLDKYLAQKEEQRKLNQALLERQQETPSVEPMQDQSISDLDAGVTSALGLEGVAVEDGLGPCWRASSLEPRRRGRVT